MKRTALLLAAVCGASVLAGCVGYVPVPAGVSATYYEGSPPPRAYRSRDRDRDGVPDRYDRRPGNPYRY